MDATDPKSQGSSAPLSKETSAEVLATLTEIGEEVNASLDLDEVLARAAALIKRHIDYEFFGVLMVDCDGNCLRHRFAVGYPPGLAENLRIPIGQGITGTAAATDTAGDAFHAAYVYSYLADPAKSWEDLFPLRARGGGLTKCLSAGSRCSDAVVSNEFDGGIADNQR